MKIQFRFDWVRSGSVSAKSFKSREAFGLVSDYVGRISKFVSCEMITSNPKNIAVASNSKLWICHKDSRCGALSSEQMAKNLKKLLDSGARELRIMIGGPDGFNEAEIKKLQPDLVWSFGPLTLPHELAAIVAAEQIYRAWTILRGLPYHSGH